MKDTVQIQDVTNQQLVHLLNDAGHLIGAIVKIRHRCGTGTEKVWVMVDRVIAHQSKFIGHYENDSIFENFKFGDVVTLNFSDILEIY